MRDRGSRCQNVRVQGCIHVWYGQCNVRGREGAATCHYVLAVSRDLRGSIRRTRLTSLEGWVYMVSWLGVASRHV